MYNMDKKFKGTYYVFVPTNWCIIKVEQLNLANWPFLISNYTIQVVNYNYKEDHGSIL